LDACPETPYSPPEDRYDLHEKVRDSQIALVKLILSYNIKLDAQDTCGNTALHSIASDTDISIVRMLVNRGANLEVLNEQEESPMFRIVRRGNYEAAKYLIAKGAKINITGKNYGAPFHAACRVGSFEMVKLLHSNGADINAVAPGWDGSPLQAAYQRDEDKVKDDIVAYLLEDSKIAVNVSSSWWGSALHLACLFSSSDAVEKLLKREEIIATIEDYIGRTPMHFALYRSMEHIKLLHDHGVDFEGKDSMGRNVLHFAVTAGRLDVVELVLSETTDLFLGEDIHGWTPLMWSLRVCSRWGTKSSSRLQIVKKLMEAGAKRLVLGKGVDRTWTPLKLAKFYDLPQPIVDAIMPTEEEVKEAGDTMSDWTSGRGKRGELQEKGYCAACLLVSYPFSISL